MAHTTSYENERKLLLDISPKSLPDDTSESGLPTEQIKEKFYAPLFYLHDLIEDIRLAYPQADAGLSALITALETSLNALQQDVSGIHVTLVDFENVNARIANLQSQINTSAGNITTLQTSIATLTAAINAARSDIVNGNLVAYKALRDGNGNIIATTYAPLSAITTINAEITKIKNGNTTVGKAARDQDGNLFDQTYIKIANIIDDLTHTDTNKPLSAYQGKVLLARIVAIETLLESTDTSLDELQEVVTYIKTNRDLITAITSAKVNVTDIVDNLTSNISNKPLSAKQGYVLKGLIDALHNTFEPNSSATYDLGSSSKKWKNLYLSGKITDGTNEASVAKIIEVSEGLGEIQQALALIIGDEDEEES